MNILYLINSYSPIDNNRSYFRSDGYIYENIRAVNKVIQNSVHDVDLAVAGFSWGPLTLNELIKFKNDEKINCSYVYGQDLPPVIAINKGYLEMIKFNNKIYDCLIVSVSDVILQSTSLEFDVAIEDFYKDECCFLHLKNDNFTFVGYQENTGFYECIPMDDMANLHVFAVKKNFIDRYNVRILADIFEGGTSAEAYVGYMTYALGGYHKISRYVNYRDMRSFGKKINTDRKTVYGKTPGKLRGGEKNSVFGSLTVPSVYLKRDLVKIIQSGCSIGAFFNPYLPFISSVPKQHKVNKYSPLSEKNKKRMYNFLKDNMFLTNDELNYDEIKCSVME